MNNRKIRVLRIIGECKTGGTETIALNYYNSLDHDKISMDFLFYGESLPRFKNDLEKHGDKVINVVDYTKALFRSVLEIRDVVKKGNYDIVHSQLNVLNAFPLFGAYIGGAKIRIASNHSTANLKYEFKKSVLKYILRPTVKVFATNYAACSKYAGQWCFGKRALDMGKIKIIHNAIDLDKHDYSETTRIETRRKNGWENKFVVGHGGRFTEQKNHKFIVEIFNEVYKKCPNAILVLAGDGHLMATVRRQVDELGLSQVVQFLGIRFDMNELMQGMDIFLFPSLYEGFGNVLTEAQAAGLHSVASNVIPKEVKMTDLVDFLSLNLSANKWAETVLSYNNDYLRKNRHQELIDAGYEIKSAAHDLGEYYVELCSGFFD